MPTQARPESSEPVLLVDRPAGGVVRLTLNRTHKRNALNDELRGELFTRLREADADPGCSVVVIRGSDGVFSAGYDLSERAHPVERAAATTDGWWARHVVDNWFEMWDMSIVIIAQVQGWCLAGGSELAAACDLVYVAEDARIGYPPVRSMSAPDMAWQPWLLGMRRGMEAMLTGSALTGEEAVSAGFANRCFPVAGLGDEVVRIATQVASVPADLLAINKRACHRAMEAAGIRTGLRATAELNALGFHQRSSREYMRGFRENGVSANLSARDRAFGDYREAVGD